MYITQKRIKKDYFVRNAKEKNRGREIERESRNKDKNAY